MGNTLSRNIKTLWFRHIRKVDDKSFYRIIGLRRSGNHALQNWLLGQMEGKTAVLDNMQKNAPEAVPHKKINLKGFERSNLLVSHEDRPLEDFFLRYNEKHFGKAQRKFAMLLLRDPYNWLASWYAWQDELGVRFREDEVFRNHTIGLWKEYARLFLKWQEAGQFSGKEIQLPVNYNRWTSNLEYRRELATNLNLKFTDRGRERVSLNGHGSSFDGLAYRGRGFAMEVLNRWQQFATDEAYLNLIDDELRALGNKIFPEIKPVFHP